MVRNLIVIGQSFRSLGAVIRDLEARRQAIADALRKVMAEPLGPPPALPVPTDERTSTIAEVDEVYAGADDGDDIDVPPVPPIEPIGAMPRAASRVLFGDD
jgi:hypothetical protein